MVAVEPGKLSSQRLGRTSLPCLHQSSRSLLRLRTLRSSQLGSWICRTKKHTYHVETELDKYEDFEGAFKRFSNQVKLSNFLYEARRRRYHENTHDIKIRKQQEKGMKKRRAKIEHYITTLHDTLAEGARSPFDGLFSAYDDGEDTAEEDDSDSVVTTDHGVTTVSREALAKEHDRMRFLDRIDNKRLAVQLGGFQQRVVAQDASAAVEPRGSLPQQKEGNGSSKPHVAVARDRRRTKQLARAAPAAKSTRKSASSSKPRKGDDIEWDVAPERTVQQTVDAEPSTSSSQAESDDGYWPNQNQSSNGSDLLSQGEAYRNGSPKDSAVSHVNGVNGLSEVEQDLSSLDVRGSVDEPKRVDTRPAGKSQRKAASSSPSDKAGKQLREEISEAEVVAANLRAKIERLEDTDKSRVNIEAQLAKQVKKAANLQGQLDVYMAGKLRNGSVPNPRRQRSRHASKKTAEASNGTPNLPERPESAQQQPEQERVVALTR